MGVLVKKYTCPRCGNTDGGEMQARQRCWIGLTVGEFEDGTHVLEDAELTDDYFGDISLTCLACGRIWVQKEI